MSELGQGYHDVNQNYIEMTFLFIHLKEYIYSCKIWNAKTIDSSTNIWDSQIFMLVVVFLCVYQERYQKYMELFLFDLM